MTRTPTEIKKGLECRIRSYNDVCDNQCDTCDLRILAYPIGERYEDALSYIQQLEARNLAMYNTILSVMHFVDKWLDDCPDYDPDADLNGVDAVQRSVKAREIALQAIERLEAERDAAVSELIGTCQVCRWEDTEKCADCHFNPEAWNVHESKWEWRGVQKEG